MHWFWRVVIAVGASSVVGALLGHSWVRFLSGGCPVDDFFDTFLGNKLTDAFLIAVLMFIVASGIFAFVSYYWPSRIPPGQCQTCGYNLTGNVSGVCSECGTKI